MATVENLNLKGSTMTTAPKVLKLNQNWEAPGSSNEFENLLVELQYALIDAPNVQAFHFIFDDFGERTLGVAVKLADGTRTFYTVYDEDTILFEAGGSLVVSSNG